MKLNEEFVSTEYKFKGRIINLREDTVILPDGNEAKREVVEHPGGVCILAITDDNKILTVKQFRAGPRVITLEIPAGKFDVKESPEICGIRELKEETGYVAGRFEKIGEFYLTPAYTNELIYLYLAKDLIFDKTNPDPDEFLQIEAIEYDKLFNMVKNNEIKDAKTVMAILFAKEYLYWGVTMEKNSKTTIRLLGIDYPVIYDDSEERMQRIGFYVDKHFNEVKLRNSKLSTTMIATLSAINIADDYFKQKEENDLITSKLKEYTKRCEKHEKETKDLQDKIDEQANEIQKLKIEIAKLEMRK